MNTVKKERPRQLSGVTYEIETGCGDLYVTINHDPEDGSVFEILLTMGKAGGCASGMSESIGRTLSMACQFGNDLSVYVSQLRGISCHQSLATPIANGPRSCIDALSTVIDNHLKGLAK